VLELKLLKLEPTFFLQILIIEHNSIKHQKPSIIRVTDLNVLFTKFKNFHIHLNHFRVDVAEPKFIVDSHSFSATIQCQNTFREGMATSSDAW